MLKEIFQILGIVSIDNKNANKALDETTKKGKTTASSLSKTFETTGKVLTTAGKFALSAGKVITGATAGITAGLSSAINRFDTLTNYPKVLSNLGFSAEDAQKSLDILTDGIDGLPTALDDAASGVQRLVSKNKDIDKSTKYFLGMNDAIIAGNAPILKQKTAIEQLTQAYTKGKPDMQDWKAIMEAMPGQLNQVAEAMGYVDTDGLYEALQKGKISMDDFMEVVVRLDEEGAEGIMSFQEQAHNSCDSIGTAVTNVANRFKKGFAKILESMNEAAKDTSLGSIANGINKVSTSIKNFLDKIGGAVKENQAFKAFMEQTAKALEKLENTIDNLSPEQLDKIVTTIVNLVKLGPILLAVGKGFSVVGKALKGLGKISEKHGEKFNKAISKMKHTTGNFIGNIKASFVIGGNYIKEGISHFKEMFENLKTVITEVGKGVAGIAGTIAKGIGKTITIVAKGVGSILLTAGKGILDLVSSLAKELFAPIINVFNRIKDSVVNAITNLKDKISNKFNEIKDSIVEKVTTLRDKLLNKFNDIKDKVINKVVEIKDSIVNKFIEVRDAVVNKVIEIKDRIVGKFTEIKDGVVSKVTEIKNGIISRISNIASIIGEKFSKIKDAIVGKLSDIGARIAEKLSPITTAISNKFNALKSIASSKIEDLKANVSAKMIDLTSTLSSHFSKIASSVSARFGEMASKISGPFSKALEHGKQGLSFLRQRHWNRWEGIWNSSIRRRSTNCWNCWPCGSSKCLRN